MTAAINCNTCLESYLHRAPLFIAALTTIAIALFTIATLGYLGLVPGLNALGSGVLISGGVICILLNIGPIVHTCRKRDLPPATMDDNIEETIFNYVFFDKPNFLNEDWKLFKSAVIDKRSRNFPFQGIVMPPELLPLIFHKSSAEDMTCYTRVCKDWRMFFLSHPGHAIAIAKAKYEHIPMGARSIWAERVLHFVDVRSAVENGKFKNALGYLKYKQDVVEKGEAAEIIVAHLCMMDQLIGAEWVAEKIEDAHCRFCAYCTIAISYAHAGDLENAKRLLDKEKTWRPDYILQRVSIDIGAAELVSSGSYTLPQKLFDERQYPHIYPIIHSRAACQKALTALTQEDFTVALQLGQEIEGIEDKIEFYSALGMQAQQAETQDFLMHVVNCIPLLITQFTQSNHKYSSWRHDRSGVLADQRKEAIINLVYLLAKCGKVDETEAALQTLVNYYKSGMPTKLFRALITWGFFVEAFDCVAFEQMPIIQYRKLALFF